MPYYGFIVLDHHKKHTRVASLAFALKLHPYNFELFCLVRNSLRTQNKNFTNGTPPTGAKTLLKKLTQKIRKASRSERPQETPQAP